MSTIFVVGRQFRRFHSVNCWTPRIGRQRIDLSTERIDPVGTAAQSAKQEHPAHKNHNKKNGDHNSGHESPDTD
jgi:hypothetical protein